jgi:hypothetical protein
LAYRAVKAEQGHDLDTLMIVWQAKGATLEIVQERLSNRYGINVSVPTVRNWLIAAKTMD